MHTKDYAYSSTSHSYIKSHPFELYMFPKYFLLDILGPCGCSLYSDTTDFDLLPITLK